MKGYWGLWLTFVAASALAATGCNGASATPDRSQTYEGTALDGAAPDFRLVDQNGVAVALSGLRGKVVVLAFLDPECTDVCPLTAIHFKSTQEALDHTTDVVFVAVNASSKANSIQDVAQATEKWGMSQVHDWHFVTGAADDLEAVWTAYDVFAGSPKPGKPREVEHTPGVFVIDKVGNKRWYISVPTGETGGNGLALSHILTRRVRQLLKET